MLSSEKRSLIRFLVIYLASTLLLFSLASWMFYTSTKHHLLDTQREMIKYEAQKIKSALWALQQSDDTPLYYPNDTEIKSAIYAKDKAYIFGSMATKQSLDYREAGRLYVQTDIEPYYLGAAYLLTSSEVDYAPIEDLQKSILFFMLLAGAFFLVLGYFLGKLFVAPMRQSLEKMNHFIQDTTHELNTPISVILTNIEMLETFGRCEGHTAELKRIEIASKTLSRIYDDLTYLNLNHQYHREIVELNLSTLLRERMVYFSAMAEAKELKVALLLADDVHQKMDKDDALRLIDNLLSNAIKYNKHQGLLEIRLEQRSLSIRDTGVGIEPKELGQILQRFRRANHTEGGFGIGLHIVSKVCQDYSLGLHIDSVENEGTEVRVQWEK